MDKYGTGQDPYCYPGSSTLRNRLNLQDDVLLVQAERDLSEIAADQIDFSLPPYDLSYLQQIHRSLFSDIYDWAGELRTIDISKGDTRFCSLTRIEPEAAKIFNIMARKDWFEGWECSALIDAVAEQFGDLNMIHPFREGNGVASDAGIHCIPEHLLSA